MGIKVKFNINEMLDTAFEKLTEEVNIRATMAFQRACKETVTYAKENHGYTQQSGALNSSTGFQLYQDGKLVDEWFEAASAGDGSGSGSGINAGKKTASGAAAMHSEPIVAVIVAGMPYAVYVESKGYDVLTSAEHQFPDILEKWLKIAFEGTNFGFEIK